MNDALAILARIGSLTPGMENVRRGIVGVFWRWRSRRIFVTKDLYNRAIDGFARCPFYVHAVALAGVAVALQLMGGRGSAPFVYSRF